MADKNISKGKTINNIKEFYSAYMPEHYKHTLKERKKTDLEEDFINELTSNFMKELKIKLDEIECKKEGQ